MLVTPSLRELQQAFASAVLRDDTAVLAHVREGTFAAQRHLQVYRNNTFANLTDALAACYPVVRRLVGNDYFDFAADGYIRQHPPASGNLHDFGGSFPVYLAALPSAQPLPYLADVARLEWAWQQAYHAADAGKLAADALATVAPERYEDLVFRPHPSVRLLDSPFPCLRIWQANQADHDNHRNVSLDEGAQRLLVIRRGLDIDIDELSVGEYALLQTFAAGRTLGEANARALDADAQFDLGTALNRHVATGTLVSFEL
jgi:hypothetical protein